MSSVIRNLIKKYNGIGVIFDVRNENLVIKGPKDALSQEQKDYIRQHKDDIINELTKEQISEVPLNDIQSAYFLGRTEGFSYGGVTCQVYFEMLYDDLDVERASMVFREIIKNHEMLQAVITEDGTWHTTDEWENYSLSYNDFSDVKYSKTGIIDGVRKEYSGWNSVIGKWPFFNFGITKFSDQSVLHLVMDFMIADWNSIWIIVSEFERLYFGESESLQSESVTFRDYLELEKQYQTTQKYQSDRRYWLDKIKDFPMYPAVTMQSEKIQNSFKRKTFHFSIDKWKRFMEMAKAQNCTPTVAIITAYAMTLAVWARQERFGLNLTMLNRMPLTPEVNRIVGDFTSVNLLDVRLGTAKSFIENMRQIQLEMSADLDHASYSGVKLMRDITSEKGKDAAIYPFVFTGAIGLVDVAGMHGRVGDYGISQTPQVFIDCQAMDTAAGLDVNFDIREGVFLPEIENAIFSYFSELLNNLASSKEVWEKEWNNEIPENQKQVRNAVNQTKKDIPFVPLHKRVEMIVKKMSDRTAIVDGKGEVTYAQLWKDTERIASVLADHNVNRGDKVGILLPKSRDQIVAVLAILYLGAVYVPLDEKQPVNRINLIIEKTGMTCILGEYQTEDKEICAELIPMNAVSNNTSAVLAESDASDLAYIIFTSGSTGVPKGVSITHSGADNTIQDINQRIGLSENDSVLALSRLNFDLSVYDIFGVLSVGGKVVFPDNDSFLDPNHWVGLLHEHNITVWNTVPAFFGMLLDELKQENQKADLRTVLLSGDWIPVGFRAQAEYLCPNAVIYSLGGATEGSIWSNIYRITEQDDTRVSIPYGYPLSNQSYRVVDSMIRDCPDYVVGELCILGKGVAAGYFGEQEQTEAAFIKCSDDEYMYRTGDYGYYESDGKLIFCGRRDFQIKLHGHRIEIGEIENILAKYDGIKACKVSLNPIDKNSLVAIVQGQKQYSENELKEYVRAYLPNYMIPSHFFSVSKIELTANGKIDHSQIEKLIRQKMEKVDEGSTEHSDISQLVKDIHEIFEQHLGVVNMPYHGNVYDFGADSLVLSRIIGKVRDHVQEMCPEKTFSFDRLLREILNHPTTYELGIFIEKLISEEPKSEQIEDTSDEKLGCFQYMGGDQSNGTARLVFHAGLGTMNCFRYLLPELIKQDKGAVYGITIQDMERYCKVQSDELICVLGKEYAETVSEMKIKKVQLIGYCMGGLIALETARVLQEKGVEIVDFLLVDSAPVFYDIEESIALELIFITNYFITVEDVYSEITNKELMDAIMYVFYNSEKRMHREDFNCLRDNPKYKKEADFLEKMEMIPIEKRFNDYAAAIKRLGKGEASVEMLLSNYHLYVHSFAASRVDAEPYFGDVRFLEASEPMDFIFTESSDMHNYWTERIIGDISFFPVKGNHITCIEDKTNAVTIAQKAAEGMED
ncbi:MAG: amino acid adenylation domain-containing protein [Oscillospiraceae bacterium]|nr:amino acid adenylation domain-containing protein [Oscillospiraceae bacterium]MBR6982289.1 amino acid adenylation domain-containing protein [Ruminococcus sp.]